MTTPPDDNGSPEDGGSPPDGNDPPSPERDTPDTAATPPTDDDFTAEAPPEDTDTSPDDTDAPPAGSSERDDSSPGLSERARTLLPAPVLDRPVLSAVGLIVVVALFARLVALGARPAHWDEARVAYWALYAQEQGSFVYRHIIHGPFVQHVSRWLFGILGTSDFVSRLPVAVIGGLLPLSALLFRERLRDSEVVALAVFLAFNPVFLYYSRFMRSDVLVGAFMFVALGMIIRFLDTRRKRYLYAVGVFATLAVASKENAILYPVTWLGALGLIADRWLDWPGADRTGIRRLFDRIHTVRQRRSDILSSGISYLPHVVGALVLSFGVFMFMFAPRGAGLDGILYPPTAAAEGTVNLGAALSSPGTMVDLVGVTVDRFMAEYGAWGGSSTSLTFEQYLSRLGAASRGLAWVSAPLIAFAIVGFARERYGIAKGRALVMLLFFAGAASLVGYPLGLSIPGGWKWNVTHVLLPLAIPAAVGAAMVGRWVVEAFADEDAIGRILIVFIIVVLGGLVVFWGANTVYFNAQHSSNQLVQHGQPNDDLDPLVSQFEAAAETEGIDVLFYSNTSMDTTFVRAPAQQQANAVHANLQPVCTNWVEPMPLNWYLYHTGTNATCAETQGELRFLVEDDEQPDMVIVRTDDESVPRQFLNEHYGEPSTYSLRSNDNKVPRALVYVDSDVDNASVSRAD